MVKKTDVPQQRENKNITVSTGVYDFGNTPETAPTIKKKVKISEDKAWNIVNKFLRRKPMPKVYHLDNAGLEERNGRTYQVVHGYVVRPNEKDGMSFTFGWYYVDVETGRLFEHRFDGDFLQPLK